jgi:hypothetical protein
MYSSNDMWRLLLCFRRESDLVPPATSAVWVEHSLLGEGEKWPIRRRHAAEFIDSAFGVGRRTRERVAHVAT